MNKEKSKGIVLIICSASMLAFYLIWPHIDYFKNAVEESKPPISLLILGVIGISYGIKLIRPDNK